MGPVWALAGLFDGRGAGESYLDRHSLRTGSIFTFTARFRRKSKTPKAVIDYLQSMSYRRYAAEELAWSGLDSDDPTLWFDEWYGNSPPRGLLDDAGN